MSHFITYIYFVIKCSSSDKDFFRMEEVCSMVRALGLRLSFASY